jgi:endonuclease III-like uncharacterized protein
LGWSTWPFSPDIPDYRILKCQIIGSLSEQDDEYIFNEILMLGIIDNTNYDKFSELIDGLTSKFKVEILEEILTTNQKELITNISTESFYNAIKSNLNF